MSKEKKEVMNKKEVVAAMSAKTGSTAKEAEQNLNAFLEVVSEALKEGKSVQFTGFGTFSVQHKPERKYLNPINKQDVVSPAKNIVKWKTGKKLADLVK